MRIFILQTALMATVGVLSACASTAMAQSAPQPSAQVDLATRVSQQRLEEDVAALVGFGTRHTLSDPEGETRGIGAARRWGAREFEQASQACGDCLEIVHPEQYVTGDRIPDPILIRNEVAIQRGSLRPDEVVIIMAHIDSRASDVMDAISDAPGANDNASGSALVIEAARVMSGRTYPTTIVYALLSGEEQGLFGGQLLADYAARQGWTVKAVLNNDVVGGSCGSDGLCDAAHVRVFSEGIRADADEAMRAAMRSRGGGNDSPSRNLSRFVADLAAAHADGLRVRQTWRSDRMGRGGDHLPFLERGFPAIRFSVAVEDYEHQHQDLRVENGVSYGDSMAEMDFAYLARVTQLNIRVADVLARTPMPPRIEQDAIMRADVSLSIVPAKGAVLYNIYRRPTDARDWQWRSMVHPQGLADGQNPNQAEAPIHVLLAPDRGDDWIFGVSSVAANGTESPIASAVPGGAFYPLAIDRPH